VPRRPNRHGPVLFLGLAAGLLLVVCSGDGGTGPSGSNVEDPRSLEIPANGGTLASLDGRARVVVPAGALAGPATLHVERLTSSEVPDTVAARSPITNVWRFGPDGFVFSSDVEIHLQYDQLPAGVDPSRLTLITTGLNGGIEILRDVQITPATAPQSRALRAAGDVRGLISHFSPFAVVVLPPAGGLFRGTNTAGPFSCNPSLPGYGSGDAGPHSLDVNITQQGPGLHVVTDPPGPVFVGTIDFGGRMSIVAEGTLSDDGVQVTYVVDAELILQPPSNNRITGTYTTTDTFTLNGTTYVCTQNGTSDFTRVN
jgi:hypothetical protein